MQDSYQWLQGHVPAFDLSGANCKLMGPHLPEQKCCSTLRIFGLTLTGSISNFKQEVVVSLSFSRLKADCQGGLSMLSCTPS